MGEKRLRKLLDMRIHDRCQQQACNLSAPLLLRREFGKVHSNLQHPVLEENPPHEEEPESLASVLKPRRQWYRKTGSSSSGNGALRRLGPGPWLGTISTPVAQERTLH